jgi:CspA family cold shock protein
VKGRIKKLFKDKGYGWITSDEDGVDRFFHMSACNENSVNFKSLSEGDRVTFEDMTGGKGPRAERIALV